MTLQVWRMSAGLSFWPWRGPDRFFFSYFEDTKTKEKSWQNEIIFILLPMTSLVHNNAMPYVPWTFLDHDHMCTHSWCLFLFRMSKETPWKRKNKKKKVLHNYRRETAITLKSPPPINHKVPQSKWRYIWLTTIKFPMLFAAVTSHLPSSNSSYKKTWNYWLYHQKY